MRFCRHPSNEQNHPTTDAAVRDLVRSRSLGEKVVPGTKRKQVVKFVLCERNLCEAEIHVRLTRSRKKEVETTDSRSSISASRNLNSGATHGGRHAGTRRLRQLLREITASLMLLDRDTRRGPRTRVLTVITRRSAHCSLLRTHKPGSPLLPCLGRTPMPLSPVPQPILDCSKSAS